MSQEIGPLTLSERQLLMDTQTKASEWTEIGEAKITTTIFGAARVSIVRKHDKIRSVIFWIALLATSVLAWGAWVVLHPAEPPQRIEFAPPISANDEMNALPFSSAVTPASANLSSVKAAPQSSGNHKIAEPADAKPSLSNPLHKSPQTTAVASPLVAHPVASSPAAVASANKVDAGRPSERETLSVDPLKEKH